MRGGGFCDRPGNLKESVDFYTILPVWSSKETMKYNRITFYVLLSQKKIFQINSMIFTFKGFKDFFQKF